MFVNISVKNAVLMMLLAVLFSGFGTSEMKAAWGELDNSFGNGGIFQDAELGYYPRDIVVQPDGKILVTGFKNVTNGKTRMMLRRYTANGALDTTFGNNGNAVINVLLNPNYNYVGWRMTMLSHSKIAVVGQAGDRVAVWVVNSNGYGNANFGNNGMKILTDYQYTDRDRERIAALDGKIILGLYDYNSERLVIYRLNADGSDDNTFGLNGKRYTGFFAKPTSGNLNYEIIAEKDTKKITIGGIGAPQGQYGYVKRVERLTSGGSYDFTFHILSETLYIADFKGFARTSDGGYIFIHSLASASDTTTTLYKLNPNGTAGISQQITNDARLLGIQSNGNIIVNANYNQIIERYDAAFNFLGGTAPNYAANYKGAVQADDKLILVPYFLNKLTLIRWMAH